MRYLLIALTLSIFLSNENTFIKDFANAAINNGSAQRQPPSWGTGPTRHPTQNNTANGRCVHKLLASETEPGFRRGDREGSELILDGSTVPSLVSD